MAQDQQDPSVEDQSSPPRAAEFDSEFAAADRSPGLRRVWQQATPDLPPEIDPNSFAASQRIATTEAIAFAKPDCESGEKAVAFTVSVASACSGVNGVVGYLLISAAFMTVVVGPLPRDPACLACGESDG